MNNNMARPRCNKQQRRRHGSDYLVVALVETNLLSSKLRQNNSSSILKYRTMVAPFGFVVFLTFTLLLTTQTAVSGTTNKERPHLALHEDDSSYANIRSERIEKDMTTNQSSELLRKTLHASRSTINKITVQQSESEQENLSSYDDKVTKIRQRATNNTLALTVERRLNHYLPFLHDEDTQSTTSSLFLAPKEPKVTLMSMEVEDDVKLDEEIVKEEKLRVIVEYKRAEAKRIVEKAVEDIDIETEEINKRRRRLRLKRNRNNSNALRGHGHSRDLLKEEGEASDGKIQVNYDFEDLSTYVVTLTKSQLLKLSMKTRSVASIHIDPQRILDESLIQKSDKDKKDRRQLNKGDDDTKLHYGLEMIQAQELWDIGATGEGVNICVIDSGVDADNQDFVGAHLNGIDTPSQWNLDPCGHGSQVASVLVAQDNTNSGVQGVAPESNVFFVRLFYNGVNGCSHNPTTFASDVIMATEICQKNGADIINISFGGIEPTWMEREAFRKLSDKGILVIAAAGNLGPNQPAKYPASYRYCLSIAAVNSKGEHPSFSEHNPFVDLAGPGVGIKGIRSTDRTYPSNIDIMTPAIVDGTSFATPHVVGVAALLISAFGKNLTLPYLRTALLASAQQPEDDSTHGATSNSTFLPTRNDYFGYGVVQGMSAYHCLVEGSCNLPPETICEDRRVGPNKDLPWHDVAGEIFNCQWYAYGAYCEDYGGDESDYRNYDLVAQEACCVCGGGNILSVASVIPPPLTPLNGQIDRPTSTSSTTSAPSSNPTQTKSPSTTPSESVSPTLYPSDVPSKSNFPSIRPSSTPSNSASPTTQPSHTPSSSSIPSGKPSVFPSEQPSGFPSSTLAPSNGPTKSTHPSNLPSHSTIPMSSPSFSSIPSILPSTSHAPSHEPSTSSRPSAAPHITEPVTSSAKSKSRKKAKKG